ncbi:MAG TPA: DNA polymerase Y family protein [Terracidiphilus sp.]|nr:DNA polymerase Y family protein [Terracidiphilus sp.]
MSGALYACVYAPEFPVQTLLRLHPELKSAPVAVLDGKAPQQFVCSMNRQARIAGAECGMTKLEAEGVPQLRMSQRSPPSETAAHAVLLECAAGFSPRIEDASHDSLPAAACACVLDIAGTERLFGPPETLAHRLREALLAAGFRASIVISANFHTALLKATTAAGITVIPAGKEASSLAKLPLNALHLEEDDAETFAIWGIRTLGELAALPNVDLVTRMGQRALQYRALSRGELPHTFQPIEPKFALEEFCDFETPVDQADSLLFVASRMIDCLMARALERALSLASLTVRMALEGGRVHERTIRPALPTADRKFLLKLLQLEIAAHPPSAAVISLTLTAQAGQSSKVQLGLFVPPTPEPSRLDVMIARLKAIAGEDRVGSPRLEDTHRPGAFRMEVFSASGDSDAAETGRTRMALRRVRPPVPVRVTLHEARPAAFRDGRQIYEVDAAYGPWRASGCWWSEESWDAEEWDVLAHAGSTALACLLVRDCSRDQWRLEAMYD